MPTEPGLTYLELSRCVYHGCGRAASEPEWFTEVDAMED
jgi:hypothetical protein